VVLYSYKYKPQSNAKLVNCTLEGIHKSRIVEIAMPRSEMKMQY